MDENNKDNQYPTVISLKPVKDLCYYTCTKLNFTNMLLLVLIILLIYLIFNK
jgi:hypothetical protein